jgi:alpha-ribazole phosphatase
LAGGKSIKLVIIRHPETNKIAGLAGEQDAPSPKGLKQLSHIARVCHDEAVQTVVHSTLPRAAVAADMLAEMLELPSIAEQGLEERNFGEWERWGWPKISIELSKLSLESRYTFKPPGGESWQEMDVRLHAALSGIAALKYDSVAVVTHAGTMRVLLTILNVKSKASAISYVPALGKCVTEEFDTSSI